MRGVLLAVVTGGLLSVPFTVALQMAHAPSWAEWAMAGVVGVVVGIWAAP